MLAEVTVPFVVGHPDQRRHAFGHVAEARLALAQRLLGLAALGDVLADLEEAAQPSVLGAQRGDGAVDEHPPSILAEMPAPVRRDALPPGRRDLVLVHVARPVFRREGVRLLGCPTASSAVQPKTASAPGVQSVMRSSASVTRIA